MQLSDILVIGDIYIINGDSKSFDKSVIPHISEVKKEATNYKQQLKQNVDNIVKPGIIRRPTPGELMAKEEPEIKRQADAAVRETLDKIPELQKAKELLQQQRGE